jgi:hypothetical protein
MSFLSNILPQSFFGVPMPWAHHDEPPQAPVAQDPSESSKQQPESGPSLSDRATEKETPAPAKETAPATSIETPKSLDGALNFLYTEQSLRLQKKANALHAEIKAKHKTIKQIDDLMALLASRAQNRPDGTPNPDGSIDCHEPAIHTLVDVLRKEGVNVPLPDGVLAQAERNNSVNVLVNQRGLISDEQREKGQEFHQCASEQNSFLQMIMAELDKMNRMMLKVIGNIGGRGAS